MNLSVILYIIPPAPCLEASTNITISSSLSTTC